MDASPIDPATPAGGAGQRFVPVESGQRIEALDVIRGFALFGIFLMNVEFFNRTISSINQGLPRHLTGLDWWAGWFVAYFVQGKFWTIFSLLFGMGFAVMLVRAERAGRAFIRVYLRRILGLAVIGAVHYIFIWDGDILFSYAVGALALLIMLYGRPRPIAIACAVLVALGFIPEMDGFFAVAGGVGMAGAIGLYLRGTVRARWRGRSWPLFSFILMAAGPVVAIAAVVVWVMPNGPIGPRLPLTVMGPLLFLAGWLSWKYRQPRRLRLLRAAVGLYLFIATAMITGGLLQRFGPDPLQLPPSTATAAATAAPPAAAASVPKRVAEARAEREKQLERNRKRNAEELAVFTRGSYAETVMWRADSFIDKAAGDAGFAILLASMFLLGTWFVRSGVMEDTAAHLPLFRRLALYGLPLGIGLGLLGSAIAMSHTPGDRLDGWGIASGLVFLGNLPACLGYVGLVVVMLHSRGAWSQVRLLAPLGRMALTNYLLQSLVCMVWFYGFALGHWGMPRAQQLLFVVLVFALQAAFSHWWLARFRYGPMEWFWRGFTYRQAPPWRVPPTDPRQPRPA
ncbi:MAG: DUF418 domain-containing protein [Pseudomonadota bacterium]